MLVAALPNSNKISLALKIYKHFCTLMPLFLSHPVTGTNTEC